MKFFAMFALAACALAVSSCNTIIGIGRDMRIAGEGMEKASTKVTGGSSDGSSVDTGGAPIY